MRAKQTEIDFLAGNVFSSCAANSSILNDNQFQSKPFSNAVPGQRVYVFADYSHFSTSPGFHMGHKTRRDISAVFV